MSENARLKRNAYMRNWRLNNKKRIQEYNKAFWERKVKQDTEKVTS